MPEHSGYGGGHGPVVPPGERFNKLYGELRAQLLSRHFAIGRYFRADHLCFTNYLGVVQRTGGTTDDQENDVVHDCLWSNVPNGVGTNVYPPNSVYNNTAKPDVGLLALPLGSGQPKDQLFERWRVGDHYRDNPLMYSGQLMVCLAVEVSLGIPGSLEILSRLLSTTRSLFKFAGAPYRGFILRWDAVTSDHWTVVPWQSNVQGKYVFGKVDHCCDFFTMTDPSASDGYLYSTPLDDPRYTAYMASSDFAALSTGQQKAYNAARLVSLHQNRYWEPSQDEVTGLLAGLSFVSAVVSDAAIKAEAAAQAAMVGGWLSPNGYLFVRPNGGFSAQGGTDEGPALEYPFSRIFTRLTGSSFAATGGFVSALQNAGLWADFAAAFAAAPFIGAGAAALAAAAAALAFGLLGLTFPAGTSLVAILAAIAGPLLGTVLVTAITAIGTTNIVKAIVILLNAESFDVWAWPGNNSGISASHGEQTAPVVAFLLGLFPSLFRFSGWMAGLAAGLGKYSENFPPFLGLSAFGDSNPTVGLIYRAWFSIRGGNSPAPTPFPPFVGGSQMSDDTNDYPNSADPFATAVAILLGAGMSTKTKLVALLTDLENEFSSSYQDQVAVRTDNESPGIGPSSSLPYFSGLVGSSVTTPQLVAEPIRPTLNYLAAVALAWFISSKVTDKSMLPPGFPAPPPAGSNLPRVTIPSGVVTAAYGASFNYQQIIPLDALPPLPSTLPAEIDLFGEGAPSKPAKPPAPSTSTTWLLSTKMSHSGNWFGAKSTEMVNVGEMLSTPGGSIVGVKLFLIDKHGVPLGGVPTSVALGRASQIAKVLPWPSPQATTGVWPFQAGARILSIGSYSNRADMTVEVQWWYAAGTACRYQIAYLVQAPAASPAEQAVDLSYMIPLLGS